MAETIIADEFGRSFRYLRISVTDACNFSCSYCLPNGYCKDPTADSPMTHSEFKHLVAGFAALGVRKIRITGGEPTLRRDIVELVQSASETPGIEQVVLSTNGYRLKGLVPALRKAGLQGVNVSVDSLDPELFQRITKTSLLPQILNGLEASLDAGLRVKLNAVLMRDLNSEDLPRFLDYIRHRPISVRFIELMRTGDHPDFFESHHVRAEALEEWLVSQGWQLRERGPLDGPAREYEHAAYAGRIGVIAPYSKDFCGNCNRLRISCRGELKLCLFGDKQHSLRAFIQNESQQSELHAAVHYLLKGKKISHFLQEGEYGNTRQFASIGG